MSLREIISCAEILRGDIKPVTSRIRGELLQGKIYHRHEPFYMDKKHLSPDFAKYQKELFSQFVSPDLPIHLFEFENAVVFGQGSVAIGNKSLLLDSAAEFVNHALAPTGASKTTDGFKLDHDHNRRSLAGRSLLVKRPWFRNFGHWLVDLMPLISLVSNASVSIENIIFGNVHQGMLRSIMDNVAKTFYPDANIVYMDDDEQLRAEYLLYVQPVHIPPLFKHPLAIQASVDAAKSIYPSSKSEFGASRLYISRQRQGMRKIVDDKDLTNLLEKHGFRTVYPEDYDFAEQIGLFENADVIVGVKGAAFATSIFCRPGTHVLLLSPPAFIDPFFWDLISSRGVNYSEIYCQSDQPTDNISHCNITVSLESVQKFLQRV